MRYSLICFLFCCVAIIQVQAHSPSLSSTLLVEQENDRWLLQIRGSLTAFETEIHHRFSKDAYQNPKEFRALVIQHVMEQVKLTFNKDQLVSFQQAKVKLGHETIVTMECIGIPETIDDAHIKNACFQHIYNSKNTLIIIREGMKKELFELKKQNQYTALVQKDGNDLMLTSPVTNILQGKLKQFTYGYWFLGISMLFVGYFFLKKRVDVSQ